MTCDLCNSTPHEILWQDDFCRVVLLNDANYPAYCRVELLAHVKEMTDLAPQDRARMMKTVFAVETAMREVIQPDKINLASLGNKRRMYIGISFRALKMTSIFRTHIGRKQ
jgi:diadenosine tetraphosphate (Ap4A) HIT family hydrolase